MRKPSKSDYNLQMEVLNSLHMALAFDVNRYIKRDQGMARDSLFNISGHRVLVFVL